MQMNNVNVFATGPAEESMWWEEICLKAMTLDIADFVDSSFSGGTSGGPASTPSLLDDADSRKKMSKRIMKTMVRTM